MLSYRGFRSVCELPSNVLNLPNAPNNLSSRWMACRADHTLLKLPRGTTAPQSLIFRVFLRPHVSLRNLSMKTTFLLEIFGIYRKLIVCRSPKKSNGMLDQDMLQWLNKNYFFGWQRSTKVIVVKIDKAQ